VQAAAVVETVPDAGARLRAHVGSSVRPDAPAFAREVAYAAARELPVGVADTVGYVALTFSEHGLGSSAAAPSRPPPRPRRRSAGGCRGCRWRCATPGRRRVCR
jgi:hypothetical protein